MNHNIFPWQQQQWQQLMVCKQQNRLPHALLLKGENGLGKKQFALNLAHSLLCRQSEQPCGQCSSCFLLKANSHPDLIWIEPESTSQIIKVDQIRAVVQFVNETASQGGMRIIIIHPAHAMNINAANALLKTLEEPSPNALIILISEQNARLPATIVSRCQKITFSKPTQQVALEWLEKQDLKQQDPQLLLSLTNGAPLKVLEWIEQDLLVLRQAFYQALSGLAHGKEDPLQIAVQYQECDINILFKFLFSWLQDLLRIILTKEQESIINLDFQAVFVKLGQRLSAHRLFNYFEHVQKTYQHIKNSLNLNRQLLLEELFILWMQHATH